MFPDRFPDEYTQALADARYSELRLRIVEHLLEAGASPSWKEINHAFRSVQWEAVAITIEWSAGSTTYEATYFGGDPSLLREIHGAKIESVKLFNILLDWKTIFGIGLSALGLNLTVLSALGLLYGIAAGSHLRLEQGDAAVVVALWKHRSKPRERLERLRPTIDREFAQLGLAAPTDMQLDEIIDKLCRAHTAGRSGDRVWLIEYVGGRW